MERGLTGQRTLEPISVDVASGEQQLLTRAIFGEGGGIEELVSTPTGARAD